MSKGRQPKLRPPPTYDVFFERIRDLMMAIPPPNEYKGDDLDVARMRLLPYIALATRDVGLPRHLEEIWLDNIIGWEIAIKAILEHPAKPVPKEFAERDALGQAEYWTYVAWEYRDKSQRGELPPIRK